MSSHNLKGKLKLTQDEVIQRFKNKHGDRYDYSCTIYNGSREKIKIKCIDHGEFEQIASNHMEGSGCSKCRSVAISMKVSLSINEIKDRIFLTHKDKYIYDFNGCKKVTDNIKITCKIHGDFKQKASLHIMGSGCPCCGIKKARDSRVMSREDFEKKSNLVHFGKYDYSYVNYVDARKKVDIICNIHGLFSQAPYAHMGGNGCKHCNKSHGVGFSESGFTKKAESNGGLARLYIVRMYNDTDEFYKIGITTRSVDIRMRKITSVYSKEVIRIVESDSDKIYKLEKYLHSIFAEYKHKPKIKFCGYTECFTKIPKDLNNIIDEYTM